MPVPTARSGADHLPGNLAAVLSPSGPSALRPSGLPPRSAAEIAEHLGDRLASFESGAAPDAPVTGVTLDSRAVRPGDLYAALPGSRAHGAQFAGDAAAAGAVACLTDVDGRAAAGRPAWRRTSSTTPATSSASWPPGSTATRPSG